MSDTAVFKNMFRTYLLGLDTFGQLDNHEIRDKAFCLREKMQGLINLTDEEFEESIKDILEDLSFTSTKPITISSQKHISWYHTRKQKDDFYWSRYREYLLRKGRSTKILDSMDEVSDTLMDHLGNPQEKMPFQQRGLIMGDVQSGKTGMYTALINKAADAGYKVIVVLAGMLNNLRSQTQSRLDMEFTGQDSCQIWNDKIEKDNRVGVGLECFKDRYRVAVFTGKHVDFTKHVNQTVSFSSLKVPALFVVKKNASILRNLYQWMSRSNLGPNDRQIETSLLLIDDESDHASINTNNEESDPTTINREIRQILDLFSQSSYVGVTATPFANIFIHPSDEEDTFKDLFPKDFITVLPTPSNYMGADYIFGEGNIMDSNGRNLPKYDMLEVIDDDEQEHYFKFRHKKELADILDDLPPSLEEAIQYFFLVNAITDYRNHINEHRAMLINVSRFTDVQNRVAGLVEEYCRMLRNDIKNYGALSIDKIRGIYSLYCLEKTWNKFSLGQLCGKSFFDVLHYELYSSCLRITVHTVNQSNSASVLNYTEEVNGLRVIVVGGMSLSRGITLEGLCVSYFYRNTAMYDSLLQMCRWFGYRPGYEDLCKIWLGRESIDFFGYINEAINELKEEIRIMGNDRKTPMDYGLKVRQAPGALLVTSRNKMRGGKMVVYRVGLSGRLVETPYLPTDEYILEENKKCCYDFIRKITKLPACDFKYDENVNSLLCRNVPSKYVIELIEKFQSRNWSITFQARPLIQYIEESELKVWDIGVPFGKDKGEPEVIMTAGGPVEVRMESRALMQSREYRDTITISGEHRRVSSAEHARIGLSSKEIERLRDKPGSGAKKYLTATRNPQLLIHIIKGNEKSDQSLRGKVVHALGLGFPSGRGNKTVEYIVNTIELRQHVEGTDDIIDDD